MKRLPYFALLNLCLLAVTAFAQFDTAEVLGTVRDHSGAVIVQGNGNFDQREHGSIGQNNVG